MIQFLLNHYQLTQPTPGQDPFASFFKKNKLRPIRDTLAPLSGVLRNLSGVIFR